MTHWRRIRDIVAGGLINAVLVSMPHSAFSYPIDCAILLCMAGSFPASAECAAAKAEVIRRITPWPVEPPLQLWRCPMGSSPGLPIESEGTLSPEIAAYRDAIEVWHLAKHVTNGSGGRDLYLTAVRGTYDESGHLVRQSVGEHDWPAWLQSTVQARTGSTLLNSYGPSFRAIVLRMQDYTGTYFTEWVSY